MAPDGSHTVAVLCDNDTVRRRIGAFLSESEDFSVDRLEGAPPGARQARLVIVDVDSGVGAAERWIRHCEGRQLPVVVCGVESSQQLHADRPWISRPFTRRRLLEVCREVLGVDHDGAGSRDDHEIPPGIEADNAAQKRPTVEIPGAGDVPDDPDESSGSDDKTRRQPTEELQDVVELDGAGTAVIEMDDVEEADAGMTGGTRTGDGKRRPLDPTELTGGTTGEPPEEDPDEQPPSGPPEPSRPDQAHPAEPSEPDGTSPARPEPPSRNDATAVSSLGQSGSRDMSGAHQVASLVAEHWDRLGLTARPADRADRLQRILGAMMRKGMDGVLEELRRIPPVEGFSGRLETVPVLDLLHTVRDRRLRGRLEVGFDDHSYVVYIEETTLQKIESLGENDDGLLIEILRDQKALEDADYRRYRQLVGELRGESLELKLQRDEAIVETRLQEAKRERALRLLTRMCRTDAGTFAFIEVPRDGGQTWPVHGLDLDIDGLLAEILRDEPIEDGEPAPDRRLVTDERRRRTVGADTLTEAESRVLGAFDEGTTVDRVCRAVDESEEFVRRAVRRFERLELLHEADRSDTGPVGGETERSGGSAKGGDEPFSEAEEPNSGWNFEMEIDEAIEATAKSGDDQVDQEEETVEEVGFSVPPVEDSDLSSETTGAGDEDSEPT